MKQIIQLSVLVTALILGGCANPKRGDAAYAPVKPRPIQITREDSSSIYQSASAWLLYEDLKARRVGDMVIVKLEEKTDAEKKSGTSTSKVTALETKNAVLAGVPVTANGVPIFDNSYDSSSSFDGKGDSSQSNKLSGTIAVTVVEILENGNLVVQGEKWISINEGEEFVRFRGIIRPIDIDPRNTISSTRVANAEIQYGGNGAVADSSSMGWLTRFFNSSWMPF